LFFPPEAGWRRDRPAVEPRGPGFGSTCVVGRCARIAFETPTIQKERHGGCSGAAVHGGASPSALAHSTLRVVIRPGLSHLCSLRAWYLLLFEIPRWCTPPPRPPLARPENGPAESKNFRPRCRPGVRFMCGRPPPFKSVARKVARSRPRAPGSGSFRANRSADHTRTFVVVRGRPPAESLSKFLAGGERCTRRPFNRGVAAAGMASFLRHFSR